MYGGQEGPGSLNNKYYCERCVYGEWFCSGARVSKMAESRDEIVSSIAASSESIREKVGDLKNIDRDSDSDDAQGDGRLSTPYFLLLVLYMVVEEETVSKENDCQ